MLVIYRLIWQSRAYNKSFINDNGGVMISILQQTERQIRKLSRGEKACLAQWLVADLGDSFPGIESQPDVCGGEPCIVRTRIPVWLLVQARKLGVSEANLLSCYPTLRAEDVAHAWAYYRSHRHEIESQIRSNEQE